MLPFFSYSFIHFTFNEGQKKYDGGAQVLELFCL